MSSTTKDIPTRLLSRSERIASGCLVWTGTLNNEGYGHISVDGRVRLAHRIAYELAVGPIPEGLVLDHLCRTRACVEPTHLEAVTSRENVMRSRITLASINSAKTHCPQGHAYDEANTYIWHGKGYTGRICKACRAAYRRRYNLAKRKAQR